MKQSITWDQLSEALEAFNRAETIRLQDERKANLTKLGIVQDEDYPFLIEWEDWQMKGPRA